MNKFSGNTLSSAAANYFLVRYEIVINVVNEKGQKFSTENYCPQIIVYAIHLSTIHSKYSK